MLGIVGATIGPVPVASYSVPYLLDRFANPPGVAELLPAGDGALLEDVHPASTTAATETIAIAAIPVLGRFIMTPVIIGLR